MLLGLFLCLRGGLRRRFGSARGVRSSPSSSAGGSFRSPRFGFGVASPRSRSVRPKLNLIGLRRCCDSMLGTRPKPTLGRDRGGPSQLARWPLPLIRRLSIQRRHTTPFQEKQKFKKGDRGRGRGVHPDSLCGRGCPQGRPLEQGTFDSCGFRVSSGFRDESACKP